LRRSGKEGSGFSGMNDPPLYSAHYGHLGTHTSRRSSVDMQYQQLTAILPAIIFAIHPELTNKKMFDVTCIPTLDEA
jgi:hypothetical protein